MPADGDGMDQLTAVLGLAGEPAQIGRAAAAATAEGLGVRWRTPGIPLGTTFLTEEPVYAAWDAAQLILAGPGRGKTACFAIPAILDAPGAAIVTSSKRDVLDATRDPRSQDGPVWVFDPDQIAGEPPTWWWDPLSYVTDEASATTLANHFAAHEGVIDAAAREHLAGLLLAAATEGQPITEVARRLTSPQMASCLTSSQVLKWVTDDTGQRRHLDPEQFVREGGTLYSLSKEGRGTAGPLVTALTVAVVEAAEKIATGMPGGRLETPMVGVLDEAANVCKWKDLPDLYSHYGSRGIVLQTILQSWSQGEEVWGKGGMNKLWSASNVAIYGGGTTSDGLGAVAGGFVSVDALVETPMGRGFVMPAGDPPVLIATVPWMAGPHADAVKASIRAHDPLAVETIAEADASLASWQIGVLDHPQPD